MKLVKMFALCAVLAVSGKAQLVLETFDSETRTGAVVFGTTWVNQITQNATTLTVGGTASDDNGWGAANLNINGTNFSFLEITAQRDAGHNAATALTITFEDDNFNPFTLQVPTSSFAIGSLTTVSIPVSWGSFSSSSITGWTIGGGTSGLNAFRMTFDNLALATTQAIPEPSTYAMLAAGLLVVGFTVRRRMVRS